MLNEPTDVTPNATLVVNWMTFGVSSSGDEGRNEIFALGGQQVLLSQRFDDIYLEDICYSLTTHPMYQNYFTTNTIFILKIAPRKYCA